MRSFALLASFVSLSFACAPVPEEVPTLAAQSGGVRIGPLPTELVARPLDYGSPATSFPGGSLCFDNSYIRIEVEHATSVLFAPDPDYRVTLPSTTRSASWNIPWGIADNFFWSASFTSFRYYGTTAPLSSVMRAVRSSPVGLWHAYSVSYPDRQSSTSGTLRDKEVLLVVYNHGEGVYEFQVDVSPYAAGTRRRSGIEIEVGHYPIGASGGFWLQSIRMACLPAPPDWDGVGTYPIGMSRVYESPGSQLWIRPGPRGCSVCEMRDTPPSPHEP